MKVLQAKVADLRCSPENPRKITPARLEQLKRALTADPEMLKARPIIALPDGTVVAGNQRLVAAQGLGWKTIPTVTVDLDPERARLWMLRDNQGYGEWEDTLVSGLLAEMSAHDVDLDLTGFSSADIDRLLAATTGDADPDEAPPLPAKAKSKPGQVYELGPHRLMCGDATNLGQVESLAAGATCALLWTDPPYGVDYTGKTKEALTIANDGAVGLPVLLAGAFAAADTILAPSARFYVAAPAGPRGTDFRVAIADVGWKFHQALVWVKDVLVLGHSDYHYRHEDILYGWKPGPGRIGRGKHAGTRWNGDNSQDTVFEVERPKRSSEHPTMKPVDLVAAHLLNSSERGDIVLDLFGGSGSTLIAAEQTGRRALLMELDPGYCDVIRARYEAFVGA